MIPLVGDVANTDREANIEINGKNEDDGECDQDLVEGHTSDAYEMIV